MTDIRLMSAAELTDLNERGREWRAKNAPAPAAKPNPVDADPDPAPSRLEGTGQLAFDFLGEPL